MSFDELKNSWQNTSGEIKSIEELRKLSKVNNHSKLKRIRIKLITETIFLTFLLLVFYNIFDGAAKPVWANILLTAGTILFIINNIAGYFILQNPVKGNNLFNLLKSFIKKLKLAAGYSAAVSFIYGTSIIIFFSSVINFNPGKYFVLAGMAAALLIFTYLNYNNWSARIKHLSNVSKEFNGTV